MMDEMRMKAVQDWIDLGYMLRNDPKVQAERDAECALLGHEPSGWQKPMYPPLDICARCLHTFEPFNGRR